MTSEAVKVAVRVRPPLGAEGAGGTCVRCPNKTTVVLKEDLSGTSDKQFSFDYVQATRSGHVAEDQLKIYNELVLPYVSHALEGYNISVFAYGQTGSGKSFTMYGSADLASTRSSAHAAVDSPGDSAGIIPRMCHSLFDSIRGKALEQTSLHTVEASYFQIYNERVYDLLPGTVATSHTASSAVVAAGDLDAAAATTSQHKLKVREDPTRGPYVEGLAWHAVDSFASVYRVIHDGNLLRAVASTNMNASSSRSHAVFTLRYKCTRISTETAAVTDLHSKIVLVDLAGSERVSKTGAEGARLREAGSINKSLTTLGMVIATLAKRSSADADSQAHIPYRESTLTWLLKDSLGGNAKSLMIATISPLPAHFDETTSTLRYAERTKMIKNTVVVNEDPNLALIRQLREEISLLRTQLAELRTTGGATGATAMPASLSVNLNFEEHMVSQLKQEWQTKLQSEAADTVERSTIFRSMGVQMQHTTDNAVEWEDADWGGQLDDAPESTTSPSVAGVAALMGGQVNASEMPYLLLRQSDPQLDGQILYSLRHGTSSIGSAADNDIRFGSWGVAAHHVCVLFDSHRWLAALAAEDGCQVWLNGVNVACSTVAPSSTGTLVAGAQAVLKHGDRIVIGDLPVVLHYVDPSPCILSDTATMEGFLCSWEMAVDEWQTASGQVPMIDMRARTSSELADASKCSTPEDVPQQDSDSEDSMSSFVGQLGLDAEDGSVALENGPQEGSSDDGCLSAPPVVHTAELVAFTSGITRAQEAVLQRWCDSAIGPRVAEWLHELSILVSEANALCSCLGVHMRASRRALWLPPQLAGLERANKAISWEALVEEKDVDAWDCGVTMWLLGRNNDKSSAVFAGVCTRATLRLLVLFLRKNYQQVLSGSIPAIDDAHLKDALVSSVVYAGDAQFARPTHPTSAFGRAYFPLSEMIGRQESSVQAAIITAWGGVCGCATACITVMPGHGMVTVDLPLITFHTAPTSAGDRQMMCCASLVVLPTTNEHADAAPGAQGLQLPVRRHDSNFFISEVEPNSRFFRLPDGVPLEACTLEITLAIDFSAVAPQEPSRTLVGTDTDRWTSLHAIPALPLGSHFQKVFSVIDGPLILEKASIPFSTYDLQLAVVSDALYLRADHFDAMGDNPRVSLTACQPVLCARTARETVGASGGLTSVLEPLFILERFANRTVADNLLHYDSNRILCLALSVIQYDQKLPFQLEGCVEAKVTDLRRIFVTTPLTDISAQQELHMTCKGNEGSLHVWQHRDPTCRALRIMLPVPSSKCKGLSEILATMASSFENQTASGQRVYLRIQFTVNIQGSSTPVAFARWLPFEVRQTFREPLFPALPSSGSVALPSLEFDGFGASFVVNPSSWAWYHSLDFAHVVSRTYALMRRCGIQVAREWNPDTAEKTTNLAETSRRFIAAGMKYVSHLFMYNKPTQLPPAPSEDSIGTEMRNSLVDLVLPDHDSTVRFPSCENVRIVRASVERSGYLLKRQARMGGWVRRWFVLQSPFLLAYHSAGDYDSGQEPSAICHLSTLRVIDDRGVLSLGPSTASGHASVCATRPPAESAEALPSARTTAPFTFTVLRRQTAAAASVGASIKDWNLQASSADEKEAWLLALLKVAELVAGSALY